MTKLTKTKMTKSEVVHRFAIAGIAFESEKDIAHGIQLQFDNGAKINVYNTGNTLIGGKNKEQSNYILYWSSDPEKFASNLGFKQGKKKGKSIKSCCSSEVVESVNQTNIDDDELPPW